MSGRGRLVPAVGTHQPRSKHEAGAARSVVTVDDDVPTVVESLNAAAIRELREETGGEAAP